MQIEDYHRVVMNGIRYGVVGRRIFDTWFVTRLNYLKTKAMGFKMPFSTLF